MECQCAIVRRVRWVAQEKFNTIGMCFANSHAAAAKNTDGTGTAIDSPFLDMQAA